MHPNLALRRFAARLEPVPPEVDAARNHFRTIRSRLTQSFQMSRVVQIGSHARGTAIRHFSDVDILVVLRRREARWGGRIVTPTTFITRVCEDLRSRYTATAIRRDGQAVVLNFRGGRHAVDVVPAIYGRFEEGRPIYVIPGGSDNWIDTSPERYKRIFQRANVASGGKLRRVSQLIRAWRFGRTPPFSLSSFYVDMLLATSGVAEGARSYGECLSLFFDELVRREARALRDPARIGGLISAAPSLAARERLLDGADLASNRASRALAYEDREKHDEARYLWGLMFNAPV